MLMTFYYLPLTRANARVIVLRQGERRMKSSSSRKLIKIVDADGWLLVRVEGSRHIFKHDVKKGIVTITAP